MVFPLIALNCGASLVSWTTIATSLKFYSLLLPLTHVILQTVVNAAFLWSGNVQNYEEIFYNDLKSKSIITPENNPIKNGILETCERLKVARKKILKISSLTSWITPFTVLKNSYLDKVFCNTFFSTRYFLVSSLSMHAFTLAFVAGTLISNPHMKLVKYSEPLSPNQFSLTQNVTVDESAILNLTASAWLKTFIAFEVDENCDNVDKLCQEFDIDINMKLYFLLILFATFFITAMLLQFFGNYYNLFRPYSGLIGCPYFVHFTVLRDMLIDTSEQEAKLTNQVTKCRRSVFTSQDVMTGDTCLHVALKHGRTVLARQMITSGSDPTLTNFNKENLESLRVSQDREGISSISWTITNLKNDEKIAFKHDFKTLKIANHLGEWMPQYQMIAVYFKVTLLTASHATFPSISDCSELLKGMKAISEALYDFSNLNKKVVGEKWFNSFCSNLIKEKKLKTLLIFLLAGLRIHDNLLLLKDLIRPLKSTCRNTVFVKVCWKIQCHSTSLGKTKYSHYLAIIGNVNMLKKLSKKKISKIVQDQRHLLLAAQNGNLEVLQFLLEKDCDKEAQDQIGRTAMHYAAENGQEETVQFLIENGANKEAQDKGGKTALHYAASGGVLKIVQLLIENGAYKEAQDRIGRTALHYAASSGDDIIVKWLIQNGANKEAQDKDGLTPIRYASGNGHVRTVPLLF